MQSSFEFISATRRFVPSLSMHTQRAERRVPCLRVRRFPKVATFYPLSLLCCGHFFFFFSAPSVQARELSDEIDIVRREREEEKKKANSPVEEASTSSSSALPRLGAASWRCERKEKRSEFQCINDGAREFHFHFHLLLQYRMKLNFLSLSLSHSLPAPLGCA